MVRNFMILTVVIGMSVVFGGCAGPEKPFEATIESLGQYECPQWFRDAKFGVYIHWGVYSVAERGEWYGRRMYEKGKEYKHHVATYGHPSEFGYKDFIPMWKAENFDPDAMLRLFKKAGARYFTPCAVHHDGFDLWDSKHQRYNAVNMGPKKDLIGMLRQATLKHGLHFGVTTHLARSYSWMQRSHGSDRRGPLKGVPYDGADPKYEELYHPPHGDSGSGDTLNAPEEWCDLWYNRLVDLIDNYEPELLYFDSGIVFLGDDNAQTGTRLFAYYYNASAARNNGKQNWVLTIKDRGPTRALYVAGTATLDLERSKADRTYADPWQTDDSIGPWGYKAGADYKTVNCVIDKLIDIVSKNGNLLLNVPPKADGTLDKETTQLLLGVGRWLDTCGEAIYETRPWVTFGEGPAVDMNQKANTSPYTGDNIRFTRSKDGKTLYAITLGWPEGDRLTIKSLGTQTNNAPADIKSVSLLGADAKLEFARNKEALTINLPARPKGEELAYAFKIDFKN